MGSLNTLHRKGAERFKQYVFPVSVAWRASRIMLEGLTVSGKPWKTKFTSHHGLGGIKAYITSQTWKTKFTSYHRLGKQSFHHITDLDKKAHITSWTWKTMLTSHHRLGKQSLHKITDSENKAYIISLSRKTKMTSQNGLTSH